MDLDDSNAPGANELNQTSHAPICYCCNTADCATFQRHDQAVQALEQDVRQAASVGQALLQRHETYVADAELERARLNSALGKLECSNEQLTHTNVSLTDENKSLMHRVERLNEAVTSSDTHIDSLTATLHSTQHEMQRLAVLASRAQHLEMQLTQLEAEQARLQATLTTTKEEERMATQRWRESERTLAELAAQMEQIEREAAEERQRHALVVERMERRSSVEKELGNAALRLQKAAGREGQKNNEVVSSFVKEILSDNATMQLNMVELQNLLSSSRDEMEVLREQLADAHTAGDAPSPFRPTQSLNHELGPQHERNSSSELHVHHHYHAPQPAPFGSGKARQQLPIRARRKKPSMSIGGSGNNINSRPRSPQRFSRMHSNQGSVSSMHGPSASNRPKRWSSSSIMTQSSFVSSGPGSPRSGSVAPSTIFERAFPDDGTTTYSATEYSRPTSPESNGFGSPEMLGMCKEEGDDDDAEFRSFSLPGPGFTLPPRQDVDFEPLQEEDDDATTSAAAADRSPLPDVNVTLGPGVTLTRGSPWKSPTRSPARSPTRSPLRNADEPRPPTHIRRKTSQTSLYSISGMDIHSSFTPAASNLSASGAYKRPSVLTTTGPTSSYVHTGPILTAATAQAKAGRQNYASGGGRALLETLAPAQREAKEAAYSPISDTFGRGWRVGGWLSGRWKGSVSSGDLRGSAAKQDTAGGLESVREDDIGVLEATSSGNASQSEATVDEWHNEEAQRRVHTMARAKQLPSGKSLRRSTRNVVQSSLDEESLRECLDEDAVV